MVDERWADEALSQGRKAATAGLACVTGHERGQRLRTVPKTRSPPAIGFDARTRYRRLQEQLDQLQMPPEARAAQLRRQREQQLVDRCIQKGRRDSEAHPHGEPAGPTSAAMASSTASQAHDSPAA